MWQSAEAFYYSHSAEQFAAETWKSASYDSDLTGSS